MLLVLTFIIACIGTISLSNAAALLHHRQVDTSGFASSCNRSITTVYRNVTVTAAPAAVTVIEPNAQAIASTIQWASSVEAAWVSQEAQLAPISVPLQTLAPTFVRTIDVPAYEVDQVPGTGSAVLYTRNGATLANVRYSTITFTVSPVPFVRPSSQDITSTIFLTRETTVTTTSLRQPFSSPTAGWNTSDSTPVNGITGVGTGTGLSGYYGSGYGTGLTVGPTGLNTTSMTANETSSPTSPGGGYRSYGGYGYPGYAPVSVYQSYGYGQPYAPQATQAYGQPTVQPYGQPYGQPSEQVSIQARQICTYASAVINGVLESWCNRYIGESTELTYTSWESTVGIPASPSTASASTTTASDTASPAQTATATPTSTIVQTLLVPITTTEVLLPVSSSQLSTSIPTPIAPFANTTVSTGLISGTVSATSGSSTPTSCGQTGPFQITFDDLPVFSAPDNTTDLPPIFNPYDHFTWSRGFSYAPPPDQIYLPQSGSRLALFDPALADADFGSPDAGLQLAGSFGAGPRSYNNHYWFNAESMFVGCNTTGFGPGTICDFVAEGYRYDAASQNNLLVVTQHFPQPACPTMQNCSLLEIFFNSEFAGLSTMSMYANVAGTIQSFWLDTIQLDWFNNTCAAGLERVGSRKK